MQGSSASHTTKVGRPSNPNRAILMQNEVSRNVGPSQSGPIGRGASVTGNAQQSRVFSMIR